MPVAVISFHIVGNIYSPYATGDCPGRRGRRRKSENLPELDVFIVLGNKDDKKEKIIAIVFINSNIYEATDVRDVCCRVAFIMFMKK